MLGHIPFKYFIYSRSESDTEATFCPLWPNTAGYSRTLWTLANSPLWKYEFSMLENWDSVLRIHPDPGQCTVHIFILIRDSVQYIYSFWLAAIFQFRFIQLYRILSLTWHLYLYTLSYCHAGLRNQILTILPDSSLCTKNGSKNKSNTKNILIYPHVKGTVSREKLFSWGFEVMV